MEIEHGRFPTHRPEDHLLNSLLLPPEYNHSVSGVLQIERSSDRKSRSGSYRQSLPAFLFALSSSASRGSSAFGACLRAHIRSSLPALVAFAAAPCDDIDQIVTAVIVGNLGACSDVLDGAYDDLVAYNVGLGIGPARMIYVTSEVLSARSVDRPTAVDLEEIAVASGLKFIGLLGRKLAAFVFDNESSLLNRRCRKKTQARAGTADTESSVGGHIRHVRRFAPVQPHRGGSAIDLSAIASWCACLVGPPWSSSQGARQARICPRGFLVGRCSASSAGRFPRTSLRVRGFAGAGGVVDFGGKRAGDGTFGCSACGVCFIRSAQFSARASL